MNNHQRCTSPGCFADHGLGLTQARQERGTIGRAGLGRGRQTESLVDDRHDRAGKQPGEVQRW